MIQLEQGYHDAERAYDEAWDRSLGGPVTEELKRAGAVREEAYRLFYCEYVRTPRIMPVITDQDEIDGAEEGRGYYLG